MLKESMEAMKKPSEILHDEDDVAKLLSLSVDHRYS